MNRIEFKLLALEKIDTAFDKLQKLENKKNEVKSELKQKYEKQVEELNRRKKELQENFKAVENATDANWKEKEQIYSASLKHFKEGFTELEKLFN